MDYFHLTDVYDFMIEVDGETKPVVVFNKIESYADDRAGYLTEYFEQIGYPITREKLLFDPSIDPSPSEFESTVYFRPIGIEPYYQTGHLIIWTVKPYLNYKNSKLLYETGMKYTIKMSALELPFMLLISKPLFKKEFYPNYDG